MSELNKKMNVEPSNENVKIAMIFLLVFSVILTIALCFVVDLFNTYSDQVEQVKVNRSGLNQEILDLRTYESKELKTYGYLDKEKGIVRIPVLNAMEKVVRNYQD